MSADRELLASVVARVERCNEGELMQLSRSLDSIERDRGRVFEEIKLPFDHRVELEDLEDRDAFPDYDDCDHVYTDGQCSQCGEWHGDDDVMNVRTVEDYDRMYRRQHGGGR